MHDLVKSGDERAESECTDEVTSGRSNLVREQILAMLLKKGKFGRACLGRLGYFQHFINQSELVSEMENLLRLESARTH
jgi:hypothetical protein